MSRIRKAAEKLQDVAGGVGGTREEAGDDEEGREPSPARFESKEERERAKPGDHLPKPDDLAT